MPRADWKHRPFSSTSSSDHCKGCLCAKCSRPIPVLSSRCYVTNAPRNCSTSSSFKGRRKGSIINDETMEEIRRNSNVFEREEAYYRLNEEIEKKSSELIKSIDSYSVARKSKVINKAAGDGPENTSELIPRSTVDLRSAELVRFDNLQNCTDQMFDSARRLKIVVENDQAKTESGYDDAPLLNQSSDNGRCTPSSFISSDFSDGTSSVPKSFEHIMTSSDGTSNSNGNTVQELRLQKATESVLKCLQSKLINYESRLTDLLIQYRQKIQENTMLESKIKVLEDDRTRLLRSSGNLQTTIDKQIKAKETVQDSLNHKSQALSLIRKESQTMKKELKDKDSQIQSLTIKAARLLEDNERLKNENKTLKMDLREVTGNSRVEIDNLTQKLTQVERHKIALTSTINKQSSTIRSLRGQLQRTVSHV